MSTSKTTKRNAARDKKVKKDEEQSEEDGEQSGKDGEHEKKHTDVITEGSEKKSSTIKSSPYAGVQAEVDSMNQHKKHVPKPSKQHCAKAQADINVMKETYKYGTGYQKEHNTKDDVDQSGEGKKTLYSMVVIFAVIIALLAIASFFASEFPLFSPNHSYQSVEEFEKIMDETKSKFPKQHELFWKMLTNVGRKHLKIVHEEQKDDLRPLSFLVAGYKGSAETMGCFLGNLGRAFTSYNYTIIFSHEFTGDDAKKRLDDKIVNSLKGNQKFIVIRDIEKLKFEAAQLFMSYSDSYSDVSYYPQSTIILTTEIPFSYDQSRDRRDDERAVASHFKEKVWQGQDNTNNIAALWTRVGDGMALFKPEEINPCSE